MGSRNWNRMAILSLGCSIATLFFEPAILPAIVLWLLAVRERRRTSAARGMGYASWAMGALLVLIILTAYVTAFVTVPRKIAAAKVRQELAALNTMRAVRDALNAHKRRFGGYPSNVLTLVEQGLLDKGYVDTAAFGYRFEYDVGDEIGKGTGLYASFAVFARPGPGFFSFGKRLFYMNKTGVIGIQKSMDAGDEIEQKLPPPPDWSAPPG